MNFNIFKRRSQKLKYRMQIDAKYKQLDLLLVKYLDLVKKQGGTSGHYTGSVISKIRYYMSHLDRNDCI